MKNLWILSAAFILAGALHAETRIDGDVALSAAIVRPNPPYPAVAKQMKIVGRVEIEVTISADGTVSDAKAVSGNALLTQAAVDAVKRWKFTPIQQNGVAVPVVAVLKFEFKS